jgi:coenzyme Q-binding protein COQ10
MDRGRVIRTPRFALFEHNACGKIPSRSGPSCTPSTLYDLWEASRRGGLSVRVELPMPAFQTSRRVAHSASEMFALVADVERYPEFVPLCQSLRVLRRESWDEGEMVFARMTVAYKLFSESFTSRVRLAPLRRVILVDYLDGPFRRMDNRWTFTPLGARSCEVGFFVDYEFRSRVLQTLMGAVFDRAFRKFASAFEARADAIYGKSRPSIEEATNFGGRTPQ